jgi:hypothetical protein
MAITRSSNQRGFVATKLYLALVFVIISFLICTTAAHALSITLAWEQNATSEDVAGYRIYYGTESQNYSNVIDVRSDTMKSVGGLKKGMNYYFAATAYNSYGLESNFSDELMLNTCSYKLSPKKKKFKAAGGTGKVTVNTQPGCDWTAESGDEEVLVINGTTSGEGKGYVFYTVNPNTYPDARTVNLSIVEIPFTVTQKGSGISN